MANISKEMLELSPKEIGKRITLAWDRDFTKVTTEEQKRIIQAEKEIENGELYSQEEVLDILGLSLEDI